jgi:alpha-methylacyl-CoA racemase
VNPRHDRAGPLTGLRVLEIGGLGPSAYATMLLADLGADVIRIDRATAQEGGPEEMNPAFDLLNRGKRSVALDLKRPEAVSVVLDLVAQCGVLTEGFRPGVAERLGIGPEPCLRRNPRLLYARMTGWGQQGPMAAKAGHDINYISLTGALHAVGEAGGPPVVPINYVGDWGGGGMYLAVGILAGLRVAEASGAGQVVDAAIVDGVLHMLSSTHGLLAQGLWTDERGANSLDGSAPYYSVYQTSDGRYMAVGAGENKFYARLIAALGIDLDPAGQHDTAQWPRFRKRIAEIFATRTRDEWTRYFADIDCCVTPVLSLYEAADHPHIQARHALRRDGALLEAAPAPRFSVTAPTAPCPPPLPGQHTRQVLEAFGLDAGAVLSSGAAIQRDP